MPDVPRNPADTVTISCPTHGKVDQSRAGHLRGKGCPRCAIEERAANRLREAADSFVEKSVKIHGDRYDYSQVAYTGNKDPVTLVCATHGPFTQEPRQHLVGKGCTKCGNAKKGDGRRLDQETFLKRAREAHGDRYDYTQAVYTHSQVGVLIGCRQHGTFEQPPNSHVRGQGCKKCAVEERAAKSLRKAADSFIAKARALHGDRYDYTKVVYLGNKSSVTIMCPDHGEFGQEPRNHLSGHGCQDCANVSRTANLTATQEYFLDRARTVHGDKYDYTKTVYINSHSDITATCPTHGHFNQRACNHLAGAGCDDCGGTALITQEQFLARARAAHSDRYDYTAATYAGVLCPVSIRCLQHGTFAQLAGDHMLGHGCRKCGNEASAKSRRGTTEEFVSRARELHGDRYDYSAVDYQGTHDPVTIGCSSHGTFPQGPSDHLRGSGCRRCATEATAEIRRLTQDAFVERSTAVHGTEKYDYSKVVYEHSQIKVTIGCTSCGKDFGQTPARHMAGAGCSSCIEYAGERAVRAILETSGVDFVAQFTHDDLRHKAKLRIDFAIPDLNVAIEFDGAQHHGPVVGAWGAKTAEEAQRRFESQRERDAAKDAWAARHGWTLVRITSLDQVAELLAPHIVDQAS